MDPIEWLRNGLFAAGGAVLAALINAWRKPSSRAELLAQEWAIASATITRLDGQVERLIGRVEDLEEQNATCQGENRQLRQWGESLVSILRREGLSIPERELPNTFLVLEGDHATLLKPDQRNPKE